MKDEAVLKLEVAPGRPGTLLSVDSTAPQRLTALSISWEPSLGVGCFEKDGEGFAASQSLLRRKFVAPSVGCRRGGNSHIAVLHQLF